MATTPVIPVMLQHNPTPMKTAAAKRCYNTVASHRRHGAALVYIHADCVCGRRAAPPSDCRDAGGPGERDCPAPACDACLHRLGAPGMARKTRLGPERFFMAIETHEIKRLMIRGVVQKIGFRVWTERQALKLGLYGWVRNRLDGSVEVVVAGPRPRVAQLIEHCRSGPPLARVDSIAVEEASENDLGQRRAGETFSLLPTV
jgi:acylphosphatase